MEPWEKVVMRKSPKKLVRRPSSSRSQQLTVTIFAILFVLMLTGLIKYLPHNLALMHRRAIYYLWGHEGGDIQILA